MHLVEVDYSLSKLPPGTYDSSPEDSKLAWNPPLDGTVLSQRLTVNHIGGLMTKRNLLGERYW